jgi:hypothetical protein
MASSHEELALNSNRRALENAKFDVYAQITALRYSIICFFEGSLSSPITGASLRVNARACILQR